MHPENWPLSRSYISSGHMKVPTRLERRSLSIHTTSFVIERGAFCRRPSRAGRTGSGLTMADRSFSASINYTRFFFFLGGREETVSPSTQVSDLA